jgi:hypothetical protein
VLHHKLGEPSGESKIDETRIVHLRNPFDLRNAVHVALHEMTTQPVANAQRTLEIHAMASFPRLDRRAAKCRDNGANREPSIPVFYDRETRSVYGNALTVNQIAIAAFNPKLSTSRRVCDVNDRPNVVDQSGEHESSCKA